MNATTKSCPDFLRFFASLRDPRRCPTRGCYRFLDLLFISFSATVSGLRDCESFAMFAHAQREWFSGFCQLPKDPKTGEWRTPSRDTFERLFKVLDPRSFAQRFALWTEALAETHELPQIALDGKTLRGSSGTVQDGLSALHLVSAWSTKGELHLGQVAVDSKSNEIMALPELLRMLDIRGALVSIDAMGCQKKIAEQIIEQGGDYVFTVKANQGKLYENIKETLNAIEALEDEVKEEAKMDSYQSEEKGHGREETRTCFTTKFLDSLEMKEQWSGCKVIGKIIRERVINGKEEIEVRYFIGSRIMSAEGHAEALRNHWGIENNLNWQMDVSFGEDACRVRNRNAAENLAAMRRQALNLLTQHPSKQSIVKKQFRSLLNQLCPA
jgi:predicted transposase YbfD/YdcC